MLKVEGLSFSYGKRKILQNINLYFKEKEFIGIIGPNGSGKTSFLKNLSRFLLPEAGAIYLKDKPLNDYSPEELARRMAVVPQDTKVNFNFSVYDLIMMGRNPHQDRWGRVSKEDYQFVEQAMHLTDTVHLKDKKYNELSGGEKQRVIIARALAQNPSLLLLDEPTASLDINYQQEIFNILSHLNQEMGLTVVVVTHDLNLSSQYCSKLILLKNGQIFKMGNPEEVLTVENIQAVYNTRVLIEENPLTGKPYIILYPKNPYGLRKAVKKEKIHIVGGGGSARRLLEMLVAAGYPLSVGVLNKGDADWETARKLDLPVVEVPPFAVIDAESIEANKEFIELADLVILTEMPFGKGNLANLEQLLNFKEKKIILSNFQGIAARDYTGGLASRYWQKLITRKNVYLAEDQQELLQLVQSLLN